MSLVRPQLQQLSAASPAHRRALALAARHVELELAWVDEEVARQAVADPEVARARTATPLRPRCCITRR